MNYYFNDMMFNRQYVNPQYYRQQQQQIEQYNWEQDQEVSKAVKAIGDLCKAVKQKNEKHQQVAFQLCLAKMASEFGW